MVIMARDWIIRSQAPKGNLLPMEKVQRLSGGGLNNFELKIESCPAEMQPLKERLVNGPESRGSYNLIL